MLDYTQLIFTSFSAAAIALLSAWAAVRLAFRRFQYQKLWERRCEAYDRVIEALHQMNAVWDNDIDAEIKGREVSQAEDEEQRERYDKARREIDRALDLGAYLLEDEAIARLKEYRQALKNTSSTESWVDLLIESSSITKSCLTDLIQIARRELGVDDLKRWAPRQSRTCNLARERNSRSP